MGFAQASPMISRPFLAALLAVGVSACNGSIEAPSWSSLVGGNPGSGSGGVGGIGGPGEGGGAPVACSTTFAPQNTPIHLLSNAELDNSIADLFYTTTQASAVAKFDEVKAGPSGFSNDTSLVPITDLMVEKFWNAAEQLSAEVIASKASGTGPYSKLATCAVGKTTVADSCYDSIVRRQAMRFWRRPVTDAEYTRLLPIIKAGASFDEGLGNFLKALVISPNFSFVAIAPPDTTAAGSTFNLSEYELATRLSYFLWQTTPDDTLLAAAGAGTLSSPAQLNAQIARMLRDPKSLRFADSLTNEWLGLKQFLNLGITAISPTTLAAMITETKMMFQDVIANDRSLMTAMSADYSFMNKALADYYGVPFTGADANAFFKISLAGTPRRGVVTQAAFLANTSGSPFETHAVLRGKAIANRIVCAHIPPPPANLDTSPPQMLPVNATPKEMLAEHTTRTACSGCHNILDPYGLSFESFDPFGKWRTTYPSLGNRTIDPSTTLPSGEAIATTAEMISYLGSSSAVRSCLSKNLLGLGLTRAASASDDACTSSTLGAMNMNPNSKFSELITSIVTSRQFLMQTGETP
jgi:hypothetical protein